MPGILAEKIGMTQIFNPETGSIPVTVLKAGPCTIIMKKSEEKDGSNSVQIGFLEKDAKKVIKPTAGHFTKKGLKTFKFLKEIKTSHTDAYTPGDTITVADFIVGEIVHVSGTSKGRGFQGVMKRHNFAGGRDSHGCSISHRVPGSIGQRTYPGRVIKGKKMPGHMGNKRVTVKNLTVVAVEPEENLILIRGAVPGHNHGIVEIYPSTPDFEKRLIDKKSKAAS
ncbi:50S ribosomal protein L3 [bacterium]|nr:50S ribosomal protein L3 [bacterium]